MTPKYSEGLAQAGTMKGASIYQDALKSFFCVPYRRQRIRCTRRNSWHWSGVIDICVLRVCGVWWRESHCMDPRGSWSCSRPYIRSSNLCFFNIPSGQIRQTPGQAPIKLWIVSAVFIDSKQHWFFCCSNRKQCDTLLNMFSPPFTPCNLGVSIWYQVNMGIVLSILIPVSFACLMSWWLNHYVILAFS